MSQKSQNSQKSKNGVESKAFRQESDSDTESEPSGSSSEEEEEASSDSDYPNFSVEVDGFADDNDCSNDEGGHNSDVNDSERPGRSEETVTDPAKDVDGDGNVCVV